MKTIKKEKGSKIVWIFTRVAAQEQSSNQPLETQLKSAREYADEKGYSVKEELGNQVQSGMYDITRSEFAKLIERIKSAKEKPYAILVSQVSRLSRNIKSLSIAINMIEKYGVHLIEVSTGLSTETERGKIEIYEKMLLAQRERTAFGNRTLVGLKNFLNEGYWVGGLPRGYTRSMTVAKNHFSNTQQINLNEEGKILQLGWQWKLKRTEDSQVIERLKALGVVISKKQLSAMWRNPFYCGINCNRLLDEPIVGKWEKMVSVEDFKAVQAILGSTF